MPRTPILPVIDGIVTPAEVHELVHFTATLTWFLRVCQLIRTAMVALHGVSNTRCPFPTESHRGLRDSLYSVITTLTALHASARATGVE